MLNDVTAKCSGGDPSRSRSLLDKQKEGKKSTGIREREHPQEAFIAALRMSEGVSRTARASPAWKA